MQENMESLYTWFPLVGIGLFFLGTLFGILITALRERGKDKNKYV